MKDPRFGIENYLRKINLEESQWWDIITMFLKKHDTCRRSISLIAGEEREYEYISGHFEDFRKFVMENTEEVDA